MALGTIPKGTMVFGFIWISSGQTLTSVVDDDGNSYTLSAAIVEATHRLYAFYRLANPALTPSINLTITASGVATQIYGITLKATGVSGVDIFGVGGSGTSVNPSAATGALSFDAELVVACIKSAGGTVTEDATFTHKSSFGAIINDAYQFPASLSSVTYAPALDISRAWAIIFISLYTNTTAANRQASSSPVASQKRSAGAIRRASSTPVTSGSRSFGRGLTTSSPPIAALARSAGAVRKIAVAMAASLVNSTAAVRRAATAPTKSLAFSTLAVRIASSSPLVSLGFAIAAIRQRITFPVASLSAANTAKRQASTSPLATRLNANAIIRNSSSSPLASLTRLQVFLRTALATSSPLALLVRSAGKRIPAIVATVVSVARSIPRPGPATTAPVASGVHLPSPVRQTSTSPVAFAIAGKPNVLQALATTINTTRHAMTRNIAVRTPAIGSPYFLGKTNALSGSGLTIQTLADVPAGAIIVVIAAQKTAAFGSAGDTAGNGYLATDVNIGAGASAIWSQVFYASNAIAMNAGAFIQLFSNTAGQPMAATAICIPVSVGGYTVDSVSNFIAGNGSTPNTVSDPLNFNGEAAIGYATYPNVASGYQPPGQFTEMAANDGNFGLRVDARAVFDLAAVQFNPTFGFAQDYGVNVVTFQTGWTPPASVTRSLARSFPSSASVIASLSRSAVKTYQATATAAQSLRMQTGKLIAASITLVASLARSAAPAPLQSSTAPTVSLVRSPGKLLSAATSPVASEFAIRVFLAMLQAASSPLAKLLRQAGKMVVLGVEVDAALRNSIAARRLAQAATIAALTRAISRPVPAFTNPTAMLAAVRSAGVFALLVTSPLASLIRAPGKLARATTTPATTASRQAGARRQASTSPVASFLRIPSPATQAMAGAVASLIRLPNKVIRISLSPVVRATKITTRGVIQALANVVATANAIPVKIRLLQSSTSPLASLASSLAYFMRRMAGFVLGRRF